MNTRTILLCAVLLSGCGDYAPATVDQCMRVELFKQCMASLPAGPTATHYNDWAEVVSECSSFAHYSALRSPSQVKKECRP